MDKKKSILNITVSISFKLLTMVLGIVVKRSLIHVCGNDVNGLNALYLSIIGFLAVAELGVGSAISFCMYRPIVDGDHQKVSALYHLFRKWYLAVGGIMLVCGLALTPVIHLFAKDYAQLDVNLYITFVLMLLSVVLTYLFGAKTALINAYKNNYITTAISSGGLVFQYVLQIVVLYITQSFSAYLVCRIVAVVAQWGITEIITRKKYTGIISVSASVDTATRHELSEKIRAMFMHKIGYLLVNTVDSIVISVFIGVVSLGLYSNYIAIMDSMSGLLMLIFTSLTSVLGHLYFEKSKETVRKYCEAFHTVNFALGVVFYLGYYAVIDNLIAIIFSEELILDRTVGLIITMNGFVQFLRRSTLVFRDSTGTFSNDRWKPLAEGVTNILFSVLLVQRIGMVGVIVATIITNLLICHIVEPYVLYKYALSASPKHYYIQNYGMIAVFCLALLVLDKSMMDFAGAWKELLVNGFISIGISTGVCAAWMLLFNKVFYKREVVK